ncbi:MAG: hypothetical protein EOP87_13260 [Verrucomicrobiaceae bacterium]|nr:MAG: hypothetical protein EOP87_13260 [Verrucomicrobiaceae bacterium]
MTPAGKRATAAILVATAGAALWWSRAHTPASVTRPADPVPVRRGAPDLEAERSMAENSARRRMDSDWKSLLTWLRSVPPPSAEEVRLRLLQLRKDWSEIDPQIRAEMIDRLLATGEDMPTGLEFRVGVHGLLAEWSTLRVFLLDVLATADPQAAAAIATRLLDSTSSADEYATALRSHTRPGSGVSKDELQSRFQTLLARPEWQTSRGFAEALDLARYLGTPAAARQLTSWNGNPGLKKLALDEFSAAHPQAMLDVLAEDTSVTGPPRAGLMARALPEDPAQLAQVDRYLATPGLSDEEVTAFLRSYPLRSATTGHRLYAKLPAPYNFEQIRSGDRAALQQAERWAADPALERFLPEIQSLQDRLGEWVRQAE